MDYQVTNNSSLQYPDGESFLFYELYDPDIDAIKREFKGFRGIQMSVCYSILENRLFLAIRITKNEGEIGVKTHSVLNKYGISLSDQDLIHTFHFGVNFAQAAAFQMEDNDRLMKIFTDKNDIVATLSVIKLTVFDNFIQFIPQIKGFLTQWAAFGALIYNLDTSIPLLLINCHNSHRIHETLQNFCSIHSNSFKLQQIPLNERNRTAILGFTYKGSKSFSKETKAHNFYEFHKLAPFYRILTEYQRNGIHFDYTSETIVIPSQRTVIACFSRENFKKILEKHYLFMKIVLVFPSQAELQQIIHNPKFSNLKGVEYRLMDDLIAEIQSR